MMNLAADCARAPVNPWVGFLVHIAVLATIAAVAAVVWLVRR